MTHDPLCGWGSENHPECFPADMCGNCEMIQRIRLDVLNDKHHDDQIVWEQAYKQGYEDAMKDANMTFDDYKTSKEEWDALIALMKSAGKEDDS